MRRRVLRVLFVTSLALPLSAPAQTRLEPLPEPLPPPPVAPGAEANPAEQGITITPGPNDVVEEINLDGQRALKVTTPDGSVYYLMPDQRDSGIRPLGDTGLRVPMRVIKQF